MSRHGSLFQFLVIAALVAALAACSPSRPAGKTGKKTIVATYAILGAIVKDLAGDEFEVKTMIPNGLDIHEWEPSAKDIETLTKADLVVENGLGLEEGMGKALDQAHKAGVGFFTASDHITARTVGAGEGIPSGDPDQAAGAKDPHLWTDPAVIKEVIDALAIKIRQDYGVDLSTRVAELDKRLVTLDEEIRAKVNALPAERRKLVTGHESLGYFAQHYGFKLVGAVIPSLTTEAESSATNLVELKRLIAENHVKVVFTEIGTPPRTVETLAKEAKVTAVPISTHSLAADDSYFTFERNLANDIIKGLK
jgi:zinc/manganese transport system substrate-binding protein